MPGEFDLIRWIRSQQAPTPMVSLPAGDDLAVLRWPAEDLLLVGVDQVLDGVHFDSAVHAPQAIGRKVINRNLSDCAAMACLPAAALAAVALPRGFDLEAAKALYLGMREAGERYDCPIVGGETGSWDGPLAVVVTILGRSDGITPVRRQGARAGDGIYVTGSLGGSLRGRHMEFVPRVEEARQLAAGGLLTAMIDLSDGLSRDLRHICEQSGTGAIIDADRVPIHEDAAELSRGDGRAALEHALHDGEDYELLFTTAQPPPLGQRIGTITAEADLFLRQDGMLRPLPAGGWEHGL